MAPSVTGVSPKEGPPGTKVTIRGEKLGSSQVDVVSVMLGEWDATLSMDWLSANKLVVLSGPVKGVCDVIVTTREGGRGSCTVQFRGVDQLVGHLKESAIWIEKFDTEREEILQELVSTHGLGQEDVLGISMEDCDSKFPENQLEEMFPGRSGNLFSESFHPVWFLLENHQQSSYDDLRAGLKFLRRKVHSEKEGQLSFLKDYAGLVIDQLDALTEMRRLFLQHAQDQDPMVKMEKALNSSKDEADKLFQEVLHRKERADRTRNALAVLQRYKFLFYLPINIQRNMDRREYDKIINDYAKMRSMFGDTEVEVFKRIMGVVETKMTEVKNVLRNRLTQVAGSFDEQCDIVRHLVNLDVRDDVGWQCIVCERDAIESVLRACYNQYSPSESSRIIDCGSNQESAPAVVMFIEDVADRMTNKFAALVKLGKGYFNGELHQTPTTSKKPDFRRMIRQVIELWLSLVRGALLPHTADSDDLLWSEPVRDTSWFLVCLREVSSACASLQNMSIDKESLDDLSQLVFDLRKHSLMMIFNTAMEKIRKLPDREAWIMDVSLTNGFGHSQLLSSFSAVVNSLVVQVEDSLLTSVVPNETPLMSDETVRRDIVVLVYNLVATFAQFLERLGFEETVSDVECESGDDQASSGSAFPLNIGKRLLIILSDCHVLRVSKISELTESFTKHSFPSSEVGNGMEKVTKVLLDLEEKLFEAYMEEKADPILGVMEMSMYEDQFDWAEVTESAICVSDYIKEVIVNCVFVHAEVYSVSPLLVGRVLSSLTEGIAEELCRLFDAVNDMSAMGRRQALLDLTAIQETLRSFTTETALSSFRTALECLPNNQQPDSHRKALEKLVCDFRSSMALYLSCFSNKVVLQDLSSDI